MNPVANLAERARLKTATSVLVRDLGGVDAAAVTTRVGRTMLDDYGLPGSRHFAPVDVVLDLERVLRRPVVTQQLALASGFDLVPIEAAQGGLVPARLAAFGREVAALFGEAAMALADHTLTEPEAETLRARVAETRRTLGELLAALDASVVTR